MWVIAVPAIAIMVAATGGIAVGRMTKTEHAAYARAIVPMVPIIPRTATATPAPTTTDLVQRAAEVKPLEDIKKGDRVLYQGHVCRWQLWNLNINTSTIKCTSGKAFQIQTGRLTPVELKTGKSTLKVRH